MKTSLTTDDRIRHLVDLRRAAGISQIAIAGLISTSRYTIMRFESAPSIDAFSLGFIRAYASHVNARAVLIVTP